MHRCIAIVLGIALLATQSPAAALHVHVYSDHDHPEHHHGLALHEHTRHATIPSDALVIGTCDDAGRHAVTLTCASATVPHFDTVAVDTSAAVTPGPSHYARVASTITDVRVHGPPARTRAPSRAPPLRSHL